MTDSYYQKEGVGEDYDRLINFPVIRTIRKQESDILHGLFDSDIQSGDTVLEIGAGTGYYTFDIASHASTVTAIEPSESMVNILQERARGKHADIQVLHEDFFDFQSESKFDHVVAIGVLDYVQDWQKFLQKCIDLSNKSVIFTVPQKGFWSSLYKFFSSFSTRIYSLSTKDIQDKFYQYRIMMQEAGLKSILTSGLTLIVKISK